MIDQVYILGIRRGVFLLSSTEIQQMLGRCGRSYTESGIGTIIVPEKDSQTAEEYISSKPEPISSTMDEVENVAFHCIPALFHGKITDEDSFNRWFHRTLASFQGKSVLWGDVVKYLTEKECVERVADAVSLTELGNISFRFFYPPEQLWAWKNKMAVLCGENLLENALAFSWLLAFQSYPIWSVDTEAVGNYKASVNDLGLYFDSGETLEGFAYHCLLTRKKPRWLKFALSELKEDADRLFGALLQIASAYYPMAAKAVKVWEICFKRGLPFELGETALDFPGMPNREIFELNSFGVHKKADLKERFAQIELYGTTMLKHLAHAYIGE